jgi:phage terminase large subunit-like protein
MNLPKTLSDYSKLDKFLAWTLENGYEREYAHILRVLCRRDLYALIRYVLSPREWRSCANCGDKWNRTTETCEFCGCEEDRPFWDHQWLLERCRDAQYDSANVLDIWARYHCKSTVKTFALTIFNFINDPNETIGIFSITKTNAEAFLRQIKQELETNELLRTLYPDIFYWEPAKESLHWTVSNGFNIKRTINSNTSSLEALGLVDSNYAGKRFSRQKYDDVVTEASVTSPEMVEKTTQGWELSMATGMPGTIREYTGTFYAYGDTYHEIVRRGIRLRLFPCYKLLKEQSKFQPHTGLPLELKYDDTAPTLFSKKHLEERERELGHITFGCQMLCNPSAGMAQGFELANFKQYRGEPHEVAKGKPKIILVDSANDKKKDSDYTCMWVLALGQDGVAYVVDGVRDRLDLDERTDVLFDLHARWKPIEVRYERYGMMVDVAHIRTIMDYRHYHFDIIEVKGNIKKDDRIARLIPWFATSKIYFPMTLPYVTRNLEETDIVQVFLEEEYLRWPTSIYRDMLDALARLIEPEHPLPWPTEDDFFDTAATNRWRRKFGQRQRRIRESTITDSWMSA